jgi:small subunit ribosomal protein S8
MSDMPEVLGGLGIVIVSTNKGVMSDRNCRKENVGGEMICMVS